MSNLISQFLDCAGIKHSRTFADSLFYEHPNRNNMLGVKQMLEVYGIKTIGIKYKDKRLAEFVFPCIFLLSGTFVVGKDLHQDHIFYFYENKEIKKNIEDFYRIWTGYALLQGYVIIALTLYRSKRSKVYQHFFC